MSKLDLDDLRAVLLDAIMKKQSVQTMFNRVYECIGLPIIAFDVSFGVIAYAFSRPFYYAHWENMVIQGRASEEAIVTNSYLNYQEMMYAAGKSQIFDWGTSEGYSQAAGPIFQEGYLIGYVGMMLESADTNVEDALKANDMLANTISLLQPADSISEFNNMSRERLAEYVLLGNGMSSELIEPFTTKYPPPYTFAILSTQEFSVSTLQYVRSVMCVKNNTITGCIHDEKYLFMLYYGIEPAKDMTAIHSSLEAIANNYSFTGAISDYFSDPLSIHSHRMQAMLTMYVCSQKETCNRVSIFQEHYNDIISYCATERFGAQVCLLPRIGTLVAEDLKCGSNCVETLEVYLNSFCRCSVAATKLGIHKNTVLYRIQRIKELLGIDLECWDNANTLLTAIDIHRMSERNNLFLKKETF